MRTLLASLPNEVLLDIVVGAALSVLSYSSLAIVLLTATLAGSGLLPANVALGLVLGANVGSGLLAVLSTVNSPVAARRLPIGNLLFKVVGCLLMLPLLRLGPCRVAAMGLDRASAGGGVPPRLQRAAGGDLHRLHRRAGACARALVQRTEALAAPSGRSTSTRSALATPSLAISCAAREALHQADVVETMLRGILPVLRDNDLDLAAAPAPDGRPGRRPVHRRSSCT